MPASSTSSPAVAPGDAGDRFPRDRQPLLEGERAAVLEMIARGATITAAAAAIDRPRQTVSTALHRDPAFAAAFERAYEASADVLEAEAWRRATAPDANGRYSDRLLELLLRARRPFRYRPTSSVEVTGAGGGPVAAVVATVDAAAVLEVLAGAGLVAPGLPAGAAVLEPAPIDAG